MSNLFLIEREIALLLEATDEHDGELTPEIEARLTTLEVERDTKIKSIIYYKKRSEAVIDAANREIERIKNLKLREERRIESIERYLGGYIGPGMVWQAGTLKISWRKSTETEVYNEELLPKDYLKTIIRYAPDKLKIKSDIEGGAEVPGARLLKKNNIQIS